MCLHVSSVASETALPPKALNYDALVTDLTKNRDKKNHKNHQQRYSEAQLIHVAEKMKGSCGTLGKTVTGCYV